MTDESVLLAVDERGVATVTLNRPHVNNAYDGDLVDRLGAHVRRCAEDARVRVIVLRGNGRHFQAGADLGWIREVAARGEDENEEVSRRTGEAMRELNEVPKPTVALVHGGCFGGGVGLVASCDVVIASEDATFAITEVRWGLAPDIIVPQLNAAMGARNVRRYALTGERFDAETARATGLVHEICVEGELDVAAVPIIEALLASAPGAVAQTKATAITERGTPADDARFRELVERHAAKRRSGEAAEGLAAFAEKRKPRWQPSS